METCVIRKGFLTLRDCGNPATRHCSACGRPACPQHLAPSTGFAQCLECAARAARPTKGKPTDKDVAPDADTYGPEWAYRYRRRYYDNGYAPIYYGASTYDDYDVRSFDSDVNGMSLDPDDQSGPSFGDS